MTLSAEELYHRGVDLGNAGRYAAARRALATARERTSDPDLRARIAGTQSFIASRTGDPVGAERLCREALASTGVSEETAALLWGQLGLLCLIRGDLDEAVSWLDRGIAGLGDNPDERAGMYLNRSVAHMQTRRLDLARADLAASVEDFAAAGRAVDGAMAEHNFGYVALLEGDLVTALDAMGRARAVLGADSSVNAAIGELDRAEVLRDAGLATETERIVARVARVFGAHRMRQARGEAELSLARSLLTHDPGAAHRAARSAARRFEALGSDTWAARANGVRVRAALGEGAVDRRGNPLPVVRAAPDAAEVDAVASALEARAMRGEAAAVRLTWELWRARRGVTGDAGGVRVVREPRNAPIDVRLLADEVRAARAASAGRERDVRRHAAHGIDALSAWQASFGSLDLQSSVGMHGNPLLIAGLESAMRSARPDVLFEWSERARHFNQQVVPLRPPPDPSLAAELAELRMIRSENPNGDWLAEPRAATLRDRARERQWSGTSAAAVLERISLDELQGELGSDTAFLTYLWGRSGVVSLVVTDSATMIIPADWERARAALGGLRADLDVSASLRSGPFADVVARTLGDRLAALSRALLDEQVAAAGARRIVITAPGVLSAIPWAMLPAMRGRVFTLATSATRWARAERTAPAGPAIPGIAVGPHVARGDEEASAAAAAWPSATVLRHGEASVDAVAELASVVDVLHVAAHGRHSADNPLFSGLELADGALFGYDIDRMPRVPATVVLSACELGRSSVLWGEEALGMTRTWLHAGSRCVIAAPVIVADDAACELLGAVHTGLAAGREPAEALAAASVATGIVAPFQCHGAGF